MKRTHADLSASLPRIGAVVRKEVWHILRDWQTLLIVVALPIVMMFLYGYALTLDIRELRVAVEDPSGSPLGRQIAARLNASPTFNVVEQTPSAGDVPAYFSRHRVKALFRLPPDFSRQIHRPGGGTIQVLIDGSDSNIGTIVRNLSEGVIRNIILDYLHFDPPEPVSIRPHVLYNPQQKSSLFFVPGLMAIILTLISALLTSLTITREKERGTMEQLLVSPLRPWEIIIGKIAPYVALAALDGALILLVGRVFFGTRIIGNIGFLTLVCLVYIVTSLSLGLIFSTVAKTQQQATLMAMPATMLPTIILSGFIFPISSMPVLLQWIAHVIPATYFLQIIRGVMLKGVGLVELWQPLVALGAVGLLFLAISIRKFEVRL